MGTPTMLLRACWLLLIIGQIAISDASVFGVVFAPRVRWALRLRRSIR